ncbi:hypothetical protein [Streptomyces sp. NPDC006551]|uniref:hypothetical protein n=1 Tax=Streptomyces sp. NPDC006551 TaxID=3157178 RepID=UPI0033BD815F
MTTDAHPPASRISDALLPPTRPPAAAAPRPAGGADGRATPAPRPAAGTEGSSAPAQPRPSADASHVTVPRAGAGTAPAQPRPSADASHATAPRAGAGTEGPPAPAQRRPASADSSNAPAQPRPAAAGSPVTAPTPPRTAAGADGRATPAPCPGADTDGPSAPAQPRPSADASHAPASTPPCAAGDQAPRPAGNPHGSAADGGHAVPPRPARDPRAADAGASASSGIPGARGSTSYEGSPANPAPGTRPGADGVPAVETTTRLRPIRDTDPTPATRRLRQGGGPALPASAPRRQEGDEAPPSARRPGQAGGPAAPGSGHGHATRVAAPRQPQGAPPATPVAAPAPAPGIPRPGHADPATATRRSAEWTTPGAEQAYGTYGAYQAYAVPPETPFETTTRLRPIRERRVGRVVAAGVCLVVGLGLIGGAVTGVVLAATNVGEPAEPVGYSQAKTLWHSAPVDTLFPRTLSGADAGPGDAARTWTRVVVAPDAACSATVMPRSVLTALSPVGCDRVLRATYTDATSSSVITVGLAFTRAEPAAMRTLGGLQLATDVPPPLSAPGTVAERFGAGQRASWWTHSLADLPVVVFSVSGFADGRPVDQPEPAAEAMAADRTTAPAQAGLGHEAKGVADGIERGLRKTVAEAVKKDEDR